MYKATTDDKYQFEVELNADKSSGKLNGIPFLIDRREIAAGKSHWIKDDKSYNVELVHLEHESKSATIKVNGHTYNVQLKDRYDDLIKSLGMENSNAHKVASLKAPMPSMVLDILVKEGDSIEKDTPLLILEAMKMENVIKSPTAGSIKKIHAIKGSAVEKNSVLMEFL